MTMRLTVLGSGSGGNCSLLSLNSDGRHRHLLIDIGFSPRQTRLRLEGTGVSIDDIDAILITHFDADHCHTGWRRQLSKQPIAIHTHRSQQRDAARAGMDMRHVSFFEEGFDFDGETDVRGFQMAHDDVGSVAYRIEHRGTRYGHATDLGRPSKTLATHFQGLHALGIESNYDRSLQLASDRPSFLKNRIMNGRGHLSNEQSLAAATSIAENSDLTHIVLLHLSRQCNCPSIVGRLWAEKAPALADRVTVTCQHEPSPTLDIAPRRLPRATTVPLAGAQMALF